MQKIKDIVLLVQKDRKVMAGIGFVILILFLWWMANRPQIGLPSLYVPPGSGASANEDIYQDLITRFGTDLDSIKQDQGRIQKDLADQRARSEQFEERTAEIFKKLLERMGEMEERQNSLMGRLPSSVDVGPESLSAVPSDGEGDENAALGEGLESFGLEQQVPEPPRAPEKKRVAFIGAGDSVRVKLLAGVNAPVDGSPYPVVFKLVSDVYGPDGSALPLGEARVVAAAQGSLADSRALFRLTSMNIRLNDGQRVVVPADGWVVGEDGIRGLRGVLIDTFGQAIAGIGFAAAIEGVGAGLSAAQLTNRQNSNGTNTTFVSGNIPNYAAGQGFQSGAQQYGRLIRERLQELRPLVQVLSGREATVVFSQNLEIPEVYDQLQHSGNTSELD